MPQDDDEAARLYRRAAEQGNPIAQYCLVNCYAAGNGNGALQDNRDAARLFGLTAEQGYAQAQYDFAVCCEEGKVGLPKDDAEAARLYRFAAD
mmetsp:Transcript_13681/g.34978  ORF Transcript_13681/g.34978 Transcript_13681/m.34978 type:complete len:93 (+) Transcript_13681:232-510(+)